ncbi:hypothetical protein HPB51_013010 [Rhipicephalus microplus]|uniref:Uncharacterized protein n=1 Tax=Rhipicephalus microplus TaxID=6941 RepID=A0A9J6F421_RHIMP|nr:hypothetical protein HPB51_013010 [Rhipicephalus microplus]
MKKRTTKGRLCDLNNARLNFLKISKEKNGEKGHKRRRGRDRRRRRGLGTQTCVDEGSKWHGVCRNPSSTAPRKNVPQPSQQCPVSCGVQPEVQLARPSYGDPVVIHQMACSGAPVISNKYLLKPTCRTEDVEWGYAFDVHLNAFFPPLVVLHVFQLFFSRLLSHHISLLFGNTLWLIALGYYIYITFLGYSALPILKNTHIFLYPLALLFVCYVVTLVCNVNLCEALNDFYAYRVM